MQGCPPARLLLCTPPRMATGWHSFHLHMHYSELFALPGICTESLTESVCTAAADDLPPVLAAADLSECTGSAVGGCSPGVLPPDLRHPAAGLLGPLFTPTGRVPRCRGGLAWAAGRRQGNVCWTDG